MEATLAAGILIFLVGAFILQGLRKIPADPPHVAAVTVFGKRTGEIKKEGWRFFPLYPFWHGAIPVDVTQKNKDFNPQDVRTPELGEIQIRVSATWRPDYEPTPPENPDGNRLIKYLNAGGQIGVENILSDIVQEKVREFAIHGVSDWEGLLKIRGEVIAEIAAAIMGDEWQLLPEGEQKRVIESLRQGNGSVMVGSLGIILNRLNITEIKPKGELAKAAELEAKERQERRGELFEMGHIQDLLERLKRVGFSNEQAMEVIQTERGKVRKDIKEIKISVSQETRTMIEKIGDAIVESILKGGRK